MQPKRRKHHPIKRLFIDIVGFGLIVLGILATPIPGPGGVPIIALGLGILALNYEWAERFLKNFDQKRKEMTEEYLNPGPPMSWILDIVAILISSSGVLLFFTQDSSWVKGLGISWIFAGVLLITSNQKRLDRMIRKVKSR